MSGPVDSNPAWVASPPSLFDIVTVYFPESDNPDKPGLKLRPGLVVKVFRGKKTGKFYASVVYGTKQLKIAQRKSRDIIIQNAYHLSQLGLHRATRFDLDHIATELPWNTEFFGTWSGRRSPTIGSLTENYIQQYAYRMMKRGLV